MKKDDIGPIICQLDQKSEETNGEMESGSTFSESIESSKKYQAVLT